MGRGSGGRIVASVGFLVVLSLASPPALAAPVAGDLHLEGPATFPAGADLALSQPLAVYAGDTSHAGFSLRADHLDVRWIEKRMVNVPVPVRYPTSTEERRWTLTNATIDLVPEGDHAGF